MNGYKIYDKAMTRLGYKGSGGNEILDTRLVGRALETVNQIALDLKLSQVSDLSATINAAPETIEALCCGVAMVLALNAGDVNKNVVFTAIYNAKRAALLSKTEHIKDNLPIAEG